MTFRAKRSSRWFEIDSMIRETTGLTDGAIDCAKTIGILNLVSRGGSLRASRAVIDCCMDRSTKRDIAELRKAGLVTYRAFADEYRVWQGTDVDLSDLVEMKRAELSTLRLSEILEGAAPLAPVIASVILSNRGFASVHPNL